MATANSSVRPVNALRRSAGGLEAAVLECLAKPRKKAVHAVRTTTRRMEAQLVLIALLPGTPPHEREARKVKRILKKLRRAAGEVRDLDVQRDLIGAEADGAADGGVRKEAKRLRRELKGRRADESERLGALIHRLHTRLVKALQGLMQVIESDEDVALSPAQLVTLVRGWYGEQADAVRSDGEVEESEQLHGIRKVAKLARYLAESAPDGASTAHRLAQRFEALQEAGGQWHDWLVLEKVAARELGGGAALPQQFAAKADRALGEFRRRLRVKI